VVVLRRVAADMARLPTSMNIVSPTEKELARQLSEERDERNKAVKALWARFEQLDQQMQQLQATPAPAQLPTQPGERRLHPVISRGLEAATAVAHHTGAKVNGQVLLLTALEKVQALMEQINESKVRFREGPPELVSVSRSSPNVALAAAGSGTGGSTEGPPATTADAIATLQTSVKDLKTKQQQQTKEVTYLKRVLIEVHIEVQMNAIRASKIALQSTELSRDDRNQAVSALDKKELECKGYIRKVCSGPQQADLMAALATDVPPLTM